MRRTEIISVLAIFHLMLFDLAFGKNEYTKLFDKCASERNAFDCLKKRALDILDSAIRDDSVYVVNDYVSLEKDPAAVTGNTDRSFKDENGTELSLDQKLDNKFHEYLTSRSVKLTIPGDVFQGRGTWAKLLYSNLDSFGDISCFVFPGRKKKGKGYGALIMGALAVGGRFSSTMHNSGTIISLPFSLFSNDGTTGLWKNRLPSWNSPVDSKNSISIKRDHWLEETSVASRWQWPRSDLR